MQMTLLIGISSLNNARNGLIIVIAIGVVLLIRMATVLKDHFELMCRSDKKCYHALIILLLTSGIIGPAILFPSHSLITTGIRAIQFEYITAISMVMIAASCTLTIGILINLDLFYEKVFK